MHRLRLLLLPFAALYAAITYCRNRLYDLGILKSKQFAIPVIVVGNLAVGGTGKSPMTEFIIRLLKDQFKITTLSRGYGRKTTGFKSVSLQSTADEVGDEPLQFKHKFPQIAVHVGEDRCAALEKLQKDFDIAILDDAYQHRKLKPSLNILLFDFASCLQAMLPLPAGNFRDSLLESKRADIIVITKTPKSATEVQKNKILKRLKTYNPAAYFTFAGIQYQQILNTSHQETVLNTKQILLVTGIANPHPLVDYLEQNSMELTCLHYPDHHNFTALDIQDIQQQFQALTAEDKIILTTEKDFQRLNTAAFISILGAENLYYLPIAVDLPAAHQEHIKNLLFEHIRRFPFSQND